MSEFTYHRILPQNAKDEYKEFDVVDFQMSFPQRSYVVGSLRLEGEVEVLVDSTITLNRNVATTIGINASLLDVKMDGDCGAHAFCESISTTVGGQIVEHLGDYGRYVKMSACAMTSPNDNNNSSNVCEMKAPSDGMTNNILKGETTPIALNMADTFPLRATPDFSIKPRVCLNGGQGTLAHSRVGDIMVSFNLARNFSALYGIDMASVVDYRLKNLRLTFNSVPDDGSKELVALRTKLNIKSSIQSSQANINVRVPAVCDAVSASFNVQSQENTPKYNNQVLHAVPNLTSTQFIFNDSTNSLVSYQIRNNAEIIDRAIDSFVDAEKNSLSPSRLANGNGFLLGLNFDEAVPLGNQKFSVELNSAITNLVTLVMYMYFHSSIQL